MLAGVNTIQTDGFTDWVEDFKGAALGDAWAAASWLSAGLPTLLPDDMASVEYLGEVGAVRDALADFDTSKAYMVELYVMPWMAAHWGTYKIFMRMNDATPVATTDGAVAELTMTGEDGSFNGSLKVYVAGGLTEYAFTGGLAGQADAGWFRVLVNANNVKCYWNGTLLLNQNIAAPAGKRIGFGLYCTEDGGLCLTDEFRVQYYVTTEIRSYRKLLLASAGGKLYRETFYGTMEEVASALTLASDRQLQAADRGGKLYIADYGNPKAEGTDGVIDVTGLELTSATYPDFTAPGIDIDTNTDVCVIYNAAGGTVADTVAIASVVAGVVTLAKSVGTTGTCHFRIWRGPKIYDPDANTLALWLATAGKGQIPSGCPMVATWRDRLVLAGGIVGPHVWYMARQGDPLDWDYGADADDGGRAVGGTDSDAGQVGEPITSLMPHSDDYLLMGGANSQWLMRGDPATGGQIDNLSRVAGTLGAAAWCLGPNGELVTLTKDGLYMFPPGGSAYPVSVSREKLPVELRDINPAHYTVSMAYDMRDRGVHLFLTPADAKGNLHWWLDWSGKTFWPLSLQGNHEPTAVYRYDAQGGEDSLVLLGGRDGYIRAFGDENETDEGYEVESWVKIGPIRMGGDDISDGLLMELIGTLALESGGVDWRVLAAPTASGCVEASARAEGTWVSSANGGRNFIARPTVRDGCFLLLLENAEKRRWALEGITAVLQRAGRQRLP
ncbi:MAG: hypothetical protein ABIL09_07970 [Gemmatimonadota bacterium]